MRLQDYFKAPSGAELLDTPIAFELLEEPKTHKIETKYGDKYAVKLKHFVTGELCDFELDEAQIGRVFSRTSKDGKTLWEAQVGDNVDIQKKSPKGEGRPYWIAEIADLNRPIVDTAKTPTAGYHRGEGVDWGGSPAEKFYTNCLLVAATGLLHAGVDPESAAVKAPALVDWAVEEGKKMANAGQSSAE